MGCGVSSAVVAQKRNRQRQGSGSTSARISPNSRSKRTTMFPVHENKIPNAQLFETLVSGVKRISSPANMMPTVCLTRDAFPLATHCLHLEDSTPTGIQLPVITCSQAKGARIVCYSQINFLQNQCFHAYDTQKMIINSINWVSGGISTMVKIALVGISKNSEQPILKVFQNLGFCVELYNERVSLQNYHLIICQSDLDMTNQPLIEAIKNYIENGGGMLIFHKHSEYHTMPLPINKLLLQYGLVFTSCLLNGGTEDNTPICIPTQFSTVRDNNFVLLTARFKAIIGQSSIDTTALDDIVTVLRYYIMITDETFTDQLMEIYNYAWDYLKKTNYSTSEGVCPDIKHGIIVVLIQELIPKLPISIYTPIKEYKIFPGETGDVQLGEFDVEIVVQPDIWIATGLWLPAGVKGTVEITGDIPPSLLIQVGSHQVSLLLKNGALKRWPNVVSFFPVTGSVTEIGTSFGGIVYVTCSEPIEICNIRMHFSNCCFYPRVCDDDDSVWEATKDIPVPWGEVETPACIFTMPTEEIKKIEDFQVLSHKFAIISNKISDFMRFSHGFPYRIVFDVETSEESQSGGYPLVFLIEDIDQILHSWDKPTQQLFTTISVMSVMSLRENCFDQTTEVALSAVCSASVMKELFPDFTPESLGIEFPPLFDELWEIYTNCGANIIPDTLDTFQQPDYQLPEIPEDMWICFVRRLCEVAKIDFTKLLERVKPIPLNIFISLHGLPVYTLEKLQESNSQKL